MNLVVVRTSNLMILVVTLLVGFFSTSVASDPDRAIINKYITEQQAKLPDVAVYVDKSKFGKVRDNVIWTFTMGSAKQEVAEKNMKFYADAREVRSTLPEDIYAWEPVDRQKEAIPLANLHFQGRAAEGNLSYEILDKKTNTKLTGTCDTTPVINKFKGGHYVEKVNFQFVLGSNGQYQCSLRSKSYSPVELENIAKENIQQKENAEQLEKAALLKEQRENEERLSKGGVWFGVFAPDMSLNHGSIEDIEIKNMAGSTIAVAFPPKAIHETTVQQIKPLDKQMKIIQGLKVGMKLTLIGTGIHKSNTPEKDTPIFKATCDPIPTPPGNGPLKKVIILLQKDPQQTQNERPIKPVCQIRSE